MVRIQADPNFRTHPPGRLGDNMKSALSSILMLSTAFALAASSSFAGAAPVTKSATAPAAASRDSTSHATFAMGCFWCAEATFEGRPGVTSVTSGYTGGSKLNPTYEEVGTGMTGHYESIDILFDPAKTSYAKLLDIFWHNVDPTQGDGQFCDRGPEYRSVIFYHGEPQHQLALESQKQIAASGRLKKSIVTQIVAANRFYPAEDYHQDFYKKNPERYHEYRLGCGRDARLQQLWGKLDTHAPGVE
jgi:peptide-methionine (S)-S-oxide reductase